MKSAQQWASGLDRHEHLLLVSSFYGPGAVGCWLMIVGSVFVSWTVNKRTNRNDTITSDFLGAMMVPTVAAVHLVHQLRVFPGDWSEMFYTFDLAPTQRSAAIEASVSICETFLTMLLPLAAISVYRKQGKRLFVTVVVGLFCWVVHEFSTNPAHAYDPAKSNLSRTPIINKDASGAIFVGTMGLVVPGLLHTHLRYSIAEERRRDEEAVVVGPSVLQQRLHQAQEKESKRRRLRWQKIMSWLYGLTVLCLQVSMIAYFSTYRVTPIGSLHSLAWRLRFFIPESNTNISELDQVVALAGGAATLMFSGYDAYKSWLDIDEE